MRGFRDVVKLVVAIAFSLLAGAIGSTFNDTQTRRWYDTLDKPGFTPPDWVFGPVWTTLYILMGIAAWLVWRQGLRDRDVRAGMSLFVVQLILNALWSYIFFGRREIFGAFVEILFLWTAVLLTMIVFFRLSRPAGWLLVPYLAWVSYAAVLNYSIWQLNR